MEGAKFDVLNGGESRWRSPRATASELPLSLGRYWRFDEDEIPLEIPLGPAKGESG